jgi:plasmid stabilization system protein ParE
MKIEDGPLRYPVVYEDVRRALVRRYPYAIFYVVEPARVVVMAVLHQRRDPARWPRR